MVKHPLVDGRTARNRIHARARKTMGGKFLERRRQDMAARAIRIAGQPLVFCPHAYQVTEWLLVCKPKISSRRRPAATVVFEFLDLAPQLVRRRLGKAVRNRDAGLPFEVVIQPPS